MGDVGTMGAHGVEHEDVVPGGDEPIDDVTTDEAGAAGHPDSHQLAIPLGRGTASKDLSEAFEHVVHFGVGHVGVDG